MVEVNLKQLAEKLSVSLPTLQTRIGRSPDFPVLERGGKNLSWKFDTDAVVAYLQAKTDVETASKRERARNLEALIEHGPVVFHEGISINDQIKAAHLRAALRDEAKECRSLVPANNLAVLLPRRHTT